MRFIALILCILLTWPASSQVAQTGAGLGKPSAGGGGNQITLDGNANANNTGTSTPVSLTTTAGSGVIGICVLGNAAPTSITATGLTFVQQSQVTNGSNISTTFYAPYTTNFSGTITANMSSSTFTTIVAFGLGKAKTSSYIDPNASLIPPANVNAGSAQTATATVATTNANDALVICGETGGTGTWTGNDSSTFTNLANVNFIIASYQIASATKSGFLANLGGGAGTNGNIIDAIESQ